MLIISVWKKWTVVRLEIKVPTGYIIYKTYTSRFEYVITHKDWYALKPNQTTNYLTTEIISNVQQLFLIKSNLFQKVKIVHK